MKREIDVTQSAGGKAYVTLEDLHALMKRLDEKRWHIVAQLRQMNWELDRLEEELDDVMASIRAFVCAS